MGRGRWVVGLAAIAAVLATLPPPAVADETPIVIWADKTRASVLAPLFPKGYRGHPVKIVEKELTAIKAELATVAPADAPDIIAAEHVWTGELASAGLVSRISLPDDVVAQFPPGLMDGFKFGFSYYGIPVQVEGVALISNTALAPNAPATFDDLAKIALRLRKNNKVEVPLAVGQGSPGDVYGLYPLFSGLGGYVFGKNAAKSLDPYNIGLDNKAFRANAPRIGAWNRSGLLSAKLDAAEAQQAFVSGQSPFWITGPWNAAALGSLPFAFRVSAVPAVVPGVPTSPLLGMKGFMVTRFAEGHGVATPSGRLLRTVLIKPEVQQAFAAAAGRYPATKSAGASYSNRLLRAFGQAGAAGVPVPNIPQMASVWGPLAQAWAASTAGNKAVPARKAFAEAQAQVQQAVG